MQHSDQFDAFIDRLVVNHVPFNGETTNLTSKVRSRFPKTRLMGVRLTSGKNSAEKSVGGIGIVGGDIRPDIIQINTGSTGLVDFEVRKKVRSLIGGMGKLAWSASFS